MSERPAAIDTFHDHLDACEQCREHPFDLCAEGARRLSGAANALRLTAGLGPVSGEGANILGRALGHARASIASPSASPAEEG